MLSTHNSIPDTETGTLGEKRVGRVANKSDIPWVGCDPITSVGTGVSRRQPVSLKDSLMRKGPSCLPLMLSLSFRACLEGLPKATGKSVSVSDHPPLGTLL